MRMHTYTRACIRMSSGARMRVYVHMYAYTYIRMCTCTTSTDYGASYVYVRICRRRNYVRTQFASIDHEERRSFNQTK